MSSATQQPHVVERDDGFDEITQAMATPEFHQNPYPLYARMRCEHPVYRDTQGIWHLTRYADVDAALGDVRLSHDRERTASAYAARDDGMQRVSRLMRRLGRAISNTDPPEHTRLRKLVTKAFTARPVQSLRPRIQAIADEELLSTCFVLVTAGAVTTTNLIGNGTLALLRHPDQLRRLQRDPTLIRSALGELMRYDTPSQIVIRVVAETLEIGGQTLEEGDLVHSVWDPPRHFASRYENEDGFSSALDYLIEPRDGDSTVLRSIISWVNNGIVDDGWAVKSDAADKHAVYYQYTLGQYRRYFSGRPATYVQVEQPASTIATADAFTVLGRRLGLTDDVTEGDAVRLALPGLDPLDAVVDYLGSHFIGLRTADGLYRFFGRNAWGWPIRVGHHLFADDTDQDKAEHAWREWLDGVFA